MLQQSSKGIPIYSDQLTQLSSSPYQFGATPYSSGYGLKGCGCGTYGGCGCSPTSPSQLRQYGQGSWLDQIASAGINWISQITGVGVYARPTPTGYPPQPGTYPAQMIPGQLQQWIPYIIGGIILYKLVK